MGRAVLSDREKRSALQYLWFLAELGRNRDQSARGVPSLRQPNAYPIQARVRKLNVRLSSVLRQASA